MGKGGKDGTIVITYTTKYFKKKAVNSKKKELKIVEITDLFWIEIYLSRNNMSIPNP